MDLDLQDVHVLVTGASGGIGIETVRLFAAMGATVTAQYNTTASTLDPLQREYATAIFPIQADLTSEADVSKLFTEINSKRPVEVLILNHGIWSTADVPLAEMSLEQWNTTHLINLTSNFLVAREYLNGLKVIGDVQRSKAAIVFVGSTAGKYGEAGHTDYASSKSANMYGLVPSLKNEIVHIAPRGRVNCVAPGWVKTPLAEEAMKDRAVVYRSIATTPLKKFASARDIANQIVILASPSVSGHVTGQVVMVEGGMEGRLLNMPEDVELPP